VNIPACTLSSVSMLAILLYFIHVHLIITITVFQQYMTVQFNITVTNPTLQMSL